MVQLDTLRSLANFLIDLVGSALILARSALILAKRSTRKSSLTQKLWPYHSQTSSAWIPRPPASSWHCTARTCRHPRYWQYFWLWLGRESNPPCVAFWPPFQLVNKLQLSAVAHLKDKYWNFLLIFSKPFNFALNTSYKHLKSSPRFALAQCRHFCYHLKWLLEFTSKTLPPAN